MTVSGKPATSLFAGEERPGERVFSLECIDSIAEGAVVVVQVEQDAVVFGRGGQVVARPATGDVGAERVEAAGQAGVAGTGDAEADGEGEVAAAALAGDDDAAGVDAEFVGVGGDPAEAGDAVVEAGGVGLDLGRGGCGDAVAEVNHGDGDAALGDDAAPGLVVGCRSTSWRPCRRRGCSRRRAVVRPTRGGSAGC